MYQFGAFLNNKKMLKKKRISYTKRQEMRIVLKYVKKVGIK